MTTAWSPSTEQLLFGEASTRHSASARAAAHSQRVRKPGAACYGSQCGSWVSSGGTARLRISSLGLDRAGPPPFVRVLSHLSMELNRLQTFDMTPRTNSKSTDVHSPSLVRPCRSKSILMNHLQTRHCAGANSVRSSSEPLKLPIRHTNE